MLLKNKPDVNTMQVYDRIQDVLLFVIKHEYFSFTTIYFLNELTTLFPNLSITHIVNNLLR